MSTINNASIMQRVQQFTQNTAPNAHADTAFVGREGKAIGNFRSFFTFSSTKRAAIVQFQRELRTSYGDNVANTAAYRALNDLHASGRSLRGNTAKAAIDAANAMQANNRIANAVAIHNFVHTPDANGRLPIDNAIDALITRHGNNKPVSAEQRAELRRCAISYLENYLDRTKTAFTQENLSDMISKDRVGGLYHAIDLIAGTGIIRLEETSPLVRGDVLELMNATAGDGRGFMNDAVVFVIANYDAMREIQPTGVFSQQLLWNTAFPNGPAMPQQFQRSNTEILQAISRQFEQQFIREFQNYRPAVDGADFPTEFFSNQVSMLFQSGVNIPDSIAYLKGETRLTMDSLYLDDIPMQFVPKIVQEGRTMFDEVEELLAKDISRREPNGDVKPIIKFGDEIVEISSRPGADANPEIAKYKAGNPSEISRGIVTNALDFCMGNDNQAATLLYCFTQAGPAGFMRTLANPLNPTYEHSYLNLEAARLENGEIRLIASRPVGATDRDIYIEYIINTDGVGRLVDLDMA